MTKWMGVSALMCVAALSSACIYLDVSTDDGEAWDTFEWCDGEMDGVECDDWDESDDPEVGTTEPDDLSDTGDHDHDVDTCDDEDHDHSEDGEGEEPHDTGDCEL